VVTGTLGAYASTNGLKDETGWTLPDQSCDQVEGADVFFSAVGMDMFVLVHGL